MSTTNAITTLNNLITEKTKGSKFINKLKVDTLINKMNNKKEFFRLNQYQKTELNIQEYENSVNASIDDNSLFYFTFVGTQKDSPYFPEYYYDTYQGKDIKFNIKKCECDAIIEFDIISINSLYTILNRLFANDNIGVIVQNY